MSDVRPILLVEDNPDDQVLICRAFAKARLSNPVHLVSDGDAAVDYLKGTGAYADRNAHPLPAVVVLDIKLPKRSGLEVLAWMREQGPLNRIPVVMLTSSRENEDVHRAYDLGANSYLLKPVEFEGLMAMVHHLGVYWTIMNESPLD